MLMTQQQMQDLLEHGTEEQIEAVTTAHRVAASMRAHREREAVALGRGTAAPAQHQRLLRVQLTTDGPALAAPSANLADIAALDAWVREHVPGADKLDPIALRNRSAAICEALRAVGVKCSKRAADAPVLLAAAWPGGNDTERLLNMHRASVPALQRTPLDQQILLVRETRERFAHRIV